MARNYKKHEGKERHHGPDRLAPVPVSRLAPPINLVDLAREIEQADKMLNTRLSSKLKVIADQIKSLQREARCALEEARQDQKLHRIRCNFKRRPGQVYHLYQKNDGSLYFSMLSPEEWSGNPPHSFQGSFRLEADMSWTSTTDTSDSLDDAEQLVRKLLNEKDE